MTKRNLRLLSLALAASLPMVISSCSNDDDLPNAQITMNLAQTDFTYGEDGVWTGWDKPGNLQIGQFNFSHSISEWGTSQGFVISRSTDTEYHDPMYLYQFTVPTGGGLYGVGSPFLVAYWNTSEAADTPFDQRSCRFTFTPENNGVTHSFIPGLITVTNNCYAWYAMTQGDNYCKKFEKGDWFKIIVHGVRADGTEVTQDIYLADCDPDINPTNWIQEGWRIVDLSDMGQVEGLYFTMASSDTGEWGMNTPSYFAVGGMMIYSEL